MIDRKTLRRQFAADCGTLEMTTLELVARGECASVAPAGLPFADRRAAALAELAARYAGSYALFAEYIDPGAACYPDAAAFDAAPLSERVAIAAQTCADNL